MDWALFVIQLLNGLQLGILLFLLSAGLTLTFGIMDFINLAHGAFYMVGALVCGAVTIWADSFWIGLLVALPVTALVGLLTEVTIIRHLYSRDHLDHVLATFGLILIFEFGDALFPTYRVLIISVGLLIALGLYLLVNHSRLGMRIRAGASNRTMISALGVNIQLLFALVFALGATLAGVAGMFIAPITEATIGMGNEIIITAFVVIIIGGIGSIKGAFVAALLIGLIDTLGRSYLDDLFKLVMSAQAAETSAPAISAMLIYLLMAAVLVFRPQGLFPPRTR